MPNLPWGKIEHVELRRNFRKTQFTGICAGGQPSQVKPCSSIGSTEEEAPFSIDDPLQPVGTLKD